MVMNKIDVNKFDDNNNKVILFSIVWLVIVKNFNKIEMIMTQIDIVNKFEKVMPYFSNITAELADSGWYGIARFIIIFWCVKCWVLF